MGCRNGLSIDDIGTVIERCSGANSATARVLPAIASGGTTADRPLSEAADDLAWCVRMARDTTAPMLMATQAWAHVLGASQAFGEHATLDDLRRLVEDGAGFSLAS
ncbi:MAG: hypothetical protein FGM55_14690 [Rhodoferax sp.]|nr:hypothetical protein [Rhodoferax sp.]